MFVFSRSFAANICSDKYLLQDLIIVACLYFGKYLRQEIFTSIRQQIFASVRQCVNKYLRQCVRNYLRQCVRKYLRQGFNTSMHQEIFAAANK